MVEGPLEEHDRVLTVPNAISALRILLVPVFAWAVVTERAPYTITTILTVIGVSDFFDGWVARRFHQISEMGKILDPVGDRLAVGVAILLLLAKGWMPLWLGIVLVVREAAVSVGAVVLGTLGIPRIDVTLIGKVATLLLMFAIPLYVIAASDYSWRVEGRLFAYLLAVPGGAASYVAGIQYAVTARRRWPQRHAVPAV